MQRADRNEGVALIEDRLGALDHRLVALDDHRLLEGGIAHLVLFLVRKHRAEQRPERAGIALRVEADHRLDDVVHASPSFSVDQPFDMEFHRQRRHGVQLVGDGFQPFQLLAGGLRIFGALDVKHGCARRFARHLANWQRDQCRQHPRFHLGDAGERHAARSKPRLHRFLIFRRQQRHQRRAVGEHHQLRLLHDRRHHLGLVEYLGGFDDQRAGAVKGSLRRRRQLGDARVGHMHGAEQIGRHLA